MDGVVRSLTASLSSVPCSAVGSIMECVLSCSTGVSPSSLFESLLDALEEVVLNKDKDNDDISSFTAALCYLLNKSGTHPSALQSFIWRAYLPIMNIHTTTPHHHQLISDQLAHLIIQSDAWNVIQLTLVPFSLRALGASIGMQQSQLSDIHQWDHQHPNQPLSPPLPLPIASHILTSLLAASLTIPQPHTFSSNLMWDICAITLRMLSLSPHNRSSAIRFLLPSIFTIFASHSSFQISLHGHMHLLTRASFFHKIWDSCQPLFSLGPLERRDAYTILSLYITIFYHKQGCQHIAVSAGAGEFDITTQHEFWDEIRRGLVAKEAFVRKQSLDMLKISLLENDGKQRYTSIKDEHIHVQDSASLSMTKRGQWAQKEAKSLGVGQIYHLNDARSNAQQRLHAFVLLYEMLEEYGTHLVEAAWNHQISVLLHFPCEQLSSSNIFPGIHQSQMETLEGMFSWMSVLWERGLCHENPQVRCLILQSFLNIDWKDRGTFTELVPESFVIGPFIQGLNDTVHHREFGVKGVYSSKTIEGATAFVSQFCKHFCMRERVAFMCRLASLVRHESFGRAGLMALSACIASAACGSQWREASSCDLEQQKSAEGDLFSNSKTDLMDTLRLVIESCKQHFNLNYRQQVCENVVDAASSVICTSDVPLETLMHFISTVPREFTDFGGSLRGNVQKWFSKCSEMQYSSDPRSTRMHLLHNLSVFPQQFIKYHHSSDQFVTYDDGDLEAWEFEAQRWARVLFLVINEHHLELIFKFLRTCGTTICEERGYLEWLPLKFLILNLALVQELQIMWLKSISCDFKVTSSMGSQKLDKSDHSTSTSASVIFEKSTSAFHFILEELVSFAKSACTIFWCCPVADSHLPSSVRGKLGGPSQRRLASSTTAAVLDAILSLKTVASLSSWCTRCKDDTSLVSTFTFLWSFAQKVIMSQKCDLNSETEAEISLAMYEALVPVLKAVASCVTPMILDLVMDSDKSLLREVKGGYWLDAMLLCFLQNINELLAVGTLARSRRAILMKWKWLCLNSLLSILHYMIENEVRCGSDTVFFSTASMKCVYSDLIGSLEKANESSVLPMLRSVRLVLGLFPSGRLGSTVSSSDGLNIEMIWELVNSAWILHVSCNKRRVAHIAALLSSVLHCSLFCDDTLHENTETAQGPFKWFVDKILEEGTKSPRTIRLAALHLTGLWLVYPRTIRYYIEELKLLSLYGSVAFDEDFEAELHEGHDARIEVSMLAKGSEVELTEAFLNTELYARVSVGVLFHELANLADNLGSIEENEGCLAARHAGKSFLLELLDSVVNDADLSKELYKKYSGIHRRKVRAWQMICILSRFVDGDIVQQVTSSLHICLYRNNMPSVRQYLEIFAIQIYLKFPTLVQEQLSPIFRDYNMRPQALSSYVFIAANIILHAAEEVVRFRHLNELLPPITPLLTSHHHSLRGFTQLLLHKVLSKMTPALDSDDFNAVPLERRCLEDLKSYLAKNSDCVRLRASIEGFLDAFNSSTSATPAGLFTARDEEIEFECVPTSLMERVNVFLNDVREDLRCSMAKDMVIIKNESLTIGECMINSSSSNAERLHSQVPRETSFDFQKKITLSKHERPCNDLTRVSSDKEFHGPLVGGLEEEDLLFNRFLQARSLAMQKLRSSRQDLVVVASLLDRIPNLAGLARTCEVFNASSLAVSDASIINDKQFQLISVTAEKWVPIIEVPYGSMIVFLEKKKQEGFAILGLEQTANSVPLDQYTFPKKMVLVLGREKEGIPVDIIHVLDGCVEIPQLGVVRSLNVHVSGAIALWEYTRQQRRLQQ